MAIHALTGCEGPSMVGNDPVGGLASHRRLQPTVNWGEVTTSRVRPHVKSARNLAQIVGRLAYLQSRRCGAHQRAQSG